MALLGGAFYMTSVEWKVSLRVTHDRWLVNICLPLLHYTSPAAIIIYCTLFPFITFPFFSVSFIIYCDSVPSKYLINECVHFPVTCGLLAPHGYERISHFILLRLGVSFNPFASVKFFILTIDPVVILQQ